MRRCLDGLIDVIVDSRNSKAMSESASTLGVYIADRLYREPSLTVCRQMGVFDDSPRADDRDGSPVSGQIFAYHFEISPILA